MTSVVYWAGSRLVEPDWGRSRPRDRIRRPHQVLWQCLEGAVALELGDGALELGPGELVSCRLDEMRSQRRLVETPIRIRWTSFHAPELPSLPRRPRCAETDLLDRLFTRLIAAYGRGGGRDAASARWLDALLQLLAEDDPATAPGLAAADRERLRAICAAIDHEPGADWSVASLARRCGWSTSHFHRQFKALVGCAPRDYVTRARLGAAQAELRDTDRPIRAIARGIGYQDPAYFCKHFRAHLGMSPGAWREASRRR